MSNLGKDSRILIIGNAGAGKTWLSAKIAETLGVPQTHMDSLYWQEGGYVNKRPATYAIDQLERLRDQPNWVLDGVFGNMARQVMSAATHLFWIDLPWEQIEENLKERGAQPEKWENPELANRSFQELLDWAKDYWLRGTDASWRFHNELFDDFTGTKEKLTTRLLVSAAAKKFKKLSEK